MVTQLSLTPALRRRRWCLQLWITPTPGRRTVILTRHHLQVSASVNDMDNGHSDLLLQPLCRCQFRFASRLRSRNVEPTNLYGSHFIAQSPARRLEMEARSPQHIPIEHTTMGALILLETMSGALAAREKRFPSQAMGFLFYATPAIKELEVRMAEFLHQSDIKADIMLFPKDPHVLQVCGTTPSSLGNVCRSHTGPTCF